jgi:hypothetical protein
VLAKGRTYLTTCGVEEEEEERRNERKEEKKRWEGLK